MSSVFVIGDSISIHYGPYLEKQLTGKCKYGRKNEGLSEYEDISSYKINGGDSSRVLQYLTRKAAENVKYDILLLNCGLHDIKIDSQSGEFQVPKNLYEENLYKIITTAKTMSNKIVWVYSTPVDDTIHRTYEKAFVRNNSDVICYNGISKKIMKEMGIEAIDLYSFTTDLDLPSLYIDHVHFKEEARKLQGEFIASKLIDILSSRK